MSFCSHNKKSGFTMLEFMVSISIGVLILATVIGGQSRYTDLAGLKALVDDVSLDLRQAQVYGVSVKVNPSDTTDFNSSYGLYFNLTSNNNYVYFSDRNPKNGYFDGNTSCATGPTQECLQVKSILRGNTITALCRVFTSGAADDCSITRADITFTRPSTEAKFFLWINGAGPQSMAGVKGLKIKFTSPKNLTKSVSIFTSGQISIQ